MNPITRALATVRSWLPLRRKQALLTGVDDSRGWWPIIRESYGGAWQQNVEINTDRVLANWAVYACMTLISSDIGKLRLKLVEQDADGIWSPTDSAAFGPVLRKPNHFQTRQKFVEQWITSKLSAGNTYVLKERDQRGVVVRLYVLDPTRVRPLVAGTGDVYYQLQDDDLSHLPEGVPAIPASEIIHDTMVCLFHPLVGISPIYACGLAATQGQNILENSTRFFANNSQPGGVLTAPAQISDETAKRLKEHWERNYTGSNAGRIAVLGDGLKYEAMSVTATDAQLIDQLKLSALIICACFHVPAWKLGIVPIPAGQKVEDLNQIYYSDCLQALIESVEACLDEGLGLANVSARTLGVEFDLDDLLRMDSGTLTMSLRDQVGAGIAAPNEARKRLNLAPVAGGATPYLQQQNYSLAALDKRDKGDPFAAPAPAAAPAEDEAEENEDDDQAEERAARIGQAAASAVQAAGEQLLVVTRAVIDSQAETMQVVRGFMQQQQAQAEAARAAEDAQHAKAEAAAQFMARLAATFDAAEPACG